MPVCKRAGLTVGRADDFFTDASLVDDIWSRIVGARIVIADCTGRNPNVFYELGLAHAYGTPSVLIAQSVDDVPFDIRHLAILVYKFTPRGMGDFEQRLDGALKDLLS